MPPTEALLVWHPCCTTHIRNKKRLKQLEPKRSGGTLIACQLYALWLFLLLCLIQSCRFTHTQIDWHRQKHNSLPYQVGTIKKPSVYKICWGYTYSPFFGYSVVLYKDKRPKYYRLPDEVVTFFCVLAVRWRHLIMNIYRNINQHVQWR